MAGYEASVKNTPYARHFGTARQYAQAASKNNDISSLATAVRELSDGLMGLALELSIVKQMAADTVKK